MTAYTTDGVQIIEEETSHTEYYECKCGSDEHVLRVSYFVDRSDPNLIEDEIYLSYFLQDKSFWKRLIHGIKYIFGYKSMYGHFGDMILTYKDSRRFKELLDKHVNSGYVRLASDQPSQKTIHTLPKEARESNDER